MDNIQIERSDVNVNSTHFGEYQSLCLLNCLRSKNTLKQGKVFEFFETDSWTRGLGKFKKVMQKVMEKHGIWWPQKSMNRVITLILKCLVTFDDPGSCNNICNSTGLDAQFWEHLSFGWVTLKMHSPRPVFTGPRVDLPQPVSSLVISHFSLSFLVFTNHWNLFQCHWKAINKCRRK